MDVHDVFFAPPDPAIAGAHPMVKCEMRDTAEGALAQADAVDVVRIDLTCMGGITRGRKLIEQCLQAGVKFAPHMNGIVHSQVFGALGHADVPVEWGVPWTGVDPFADSLRQPEIAADGLMKPLPEEPGFGTLVNRDWVLSQPYEDPDHLLET